MIKANLLPLYRAASFCLQPLAGPFLRRRLKRGKEDSLRLREKLGMTQLSRPAGALVWLHGASIGEAMALRPLVQRLLDRGFKVLLTTGTATSARLVQGQFGSGPVHQFAPLDGPLFVRRFLDHWAPDLALVAESEFWPNMFHALARRNIPLIVVNARMSPRSARRWARLPGTIAALLHDVRLCLAQSDADASHLSALGMPAVLSVGNLKYDAAAPTADARALSLLNGAIGTRPAWLAASTHPGEEDVIARVHRAASALMPELLTMIAPRHHDRGEMIAAELTRSGFRVAQRSHNELPGPQTEIYIADSMGEMGVLFRAAPIVLMGKSLDLASGARGGGQNPIEPAKLGCAVLHGPLVSNFATTYSALDDACGALLVPDESALTEALKLLFRDTALMRKMARAAKETVSHMTGASDHTMAALAPWLDALRGLP
ncbi:MAG: 3-deoxy-D-manno-octulosonic acid transferase [Hyphomicrobiales bacterium]|nr:3-deoxy-D-manno-octulosonic acid transferase [Hyphomicrobiales bacterium]